MRMVRHSSLSALITWVPLVLLLLSAPAWAGEDTSVSVVLAPDASTLVPSSSHVITGWLYALDDLGSIHIDLTSTGPVSLDGPLSIDFGALADGDSVAISIPVTYGAEGLSQVTLAVTSALDPEASVSGAESFDFFSLVRTPPFHSVTSMDGAEVAEFEGVEADSASGLITPQQADSLEDEYLEAPQDDAIDSTGTSPGMSVRPSRPDGAMVANVTVVGKLVWKDQAGNTHPAILTNVDLYDHETVGADRLLASGTTDQTGTVSFTVPNDDGILGGGIDAYLVIYTSNPLVIVHADGQPSYRAATIRKDNLADNAKYTYRVTILNTTDTGNAWSVFQALTQAALYAQTRNGAGLPQVTCIWPAAQGCQFSPAVGIEINSRSRWEWDPIMHEYGHYVQYRLGTTDNPGGPHSAPCLSDQQGSKSRGIRMAWAEGWATYFGIVAQSVRNLAALGLPAVGDVSYDSHMYQALQLHVSLEAQDNKYFGEDCEWAVSRHLWDLFDTANDGYESISIADQTLWDRVKTAKAKTLSQFWGVMRANAADAGADLAIAAVAANHQTGSVPNSPADGALVGAGTRFRWPRVVGCSAAYRGDGFDMAFFKPGTPPVRLAPIATMVNLADSSHVLTQAEFDALAPQAADDGTLLWAVEARNSAAPATGPYLGLARTVQFTIPVATALALASAEAAPDRVTLAWQGPHAGTLAATVYRRQGDGLWASLGRPDVLSADELGYVDRTVSAGAHYGYRLGYPDGGTEAFTNETLVDVPAGLAFAVEGFRPNPAGSRPLIAFTTPESRPVRIELLDVAGRRVRSRDLGTPAAGPHLVDLGGGLAPGVYLVRVHYGSSTLGARGIVMP